MPTSQRYHYAHRVIFRMRQSRFILYFFIAILLAACSKPDAKYSRWEVTGGTREGIRYSSLTQIDTTNVQQLQVAWTYRTGDADTVNHSQIQCNPIIIDDILYATTPQLKLIALHAATGKTKWVFDPRQPTSDNRVLDFILNNNRGVTYWTDGSAATIFYVAGSTLYAVEAATGKLSEPFGTGGKIDLHDGLGEDVHDLFVTATSPGVIYKDLFIIGSRVSEGPDAAPGHIRAYDVRTGKQKWTFHTIPQPGEYGYDTWENPDAWKFTGGANAWAGFTLDEQRGILFAPTGSASFDFYGGNRKGNNLFANCILALDAATGKRIWHFQYLHHDIWDRDIPTPPALVTVMHEGKKIDAVAQPTKTGFIYIFERETGKPLFDIREEPVPPSTIPGEKISPTQPLPAKPEPFMRQSFTEADLNDLLPAASFDTIRKQFHAYQKGHMFTPPSREGSIFFPGLDGGAEWGGPSVDPATGILYVNANEIPWVITIADVEKSNATKETYAIAGKRLYLNHCSSCHGVNREGGGNYPALTGIKSKYTTPQFTDLVATGRRMMPAFKHLSEQEREAIASFVLNIEMLQKKEFIPQDSSVDLRAIPYRITGYNKFVSKEGYPAIKPPWGTLNAVDLNSGNIVWRIPLGEHPEFPQATTPTGTENYGGPVVTAGGVLFIAATQDGKFRAFNKRTGKLLWETRLPVPGFATPAVYAVKGKQYVVIACGGGKLKTKSGDTYIAFALPEDLAK
jgi:quinoprotein glucose dehydrogenase